MNTISVPIFQGFPDGCCEVEYPLGEITFDLAVRYMVNFCKINEMAPEQCCLKAVDRQYFLRVQKREWK